MEGAGQTAQNQENSQTVPNSSIDFGEKPEVKPRQRAMGGVWISSSDFPHAFQHLIVYHNLNSYKKTETYHDIWQDQQQPYCANEKDIYVKLTVDEELFNQFKADNRLENGLTLAEALAPPTQEQINKESWDEGKNMLPGERAKDR